MENPLNPSETTLFNECGFKISDFTLEAESKDYEACRFRVNGQEAVYRNAKPTPKKVGQFVTFWKRNENGQIEPLDIEDKIDFYVVRVEAKNNLGHFVFPKSVLIQKGIISTDQKEGKRGFRVYPIWDQPNNKQADRTQQWQLDYFYKIDNSIEISRVIELLGDK